MAAMTTQEASSPSSRFSYHVFLSFRGKDTRKTFTDHLYAALVSAGFRTFRDDDDMKRGEYMKSEVKKAIEQSRCSIIVISKDFASSTWCLDELVMILECKKICGNIVIPVFYDVDPVQIRNLTGFISSAFFRHENQAEGETEERKAEWMHKVKGWRTALREVADLGGMVLHNQSDGHESKFIEKIVKAIGDKLNRTALSITPHLVGMSSRAKNISMWLQDGSTSVGVLSICGMGGIGKSTIAKFVYNQNFEKFERSSFLANIRDTTEQVNGLARLQRQLLSDISRMKETKISNVDEGIIKIKNVISCKQVLLVLDNVDHVDQLNAVFGMKEWFYPGSKIIITTRHERLFNAAHEIDKLYLVDHLDESESFELFSWHAFGQDHPIEGCMEYSKRVVYHCGGLPLALQVLGSSFFGRSKDVWESAVKKLEATSDSRVINKLKISYDSLQDDHDKNLFLHIACFFVRKDRDFAIDVLDECDFYTAVGIQNLIDRNLLTINEHNKLMMHQLLRNMGREIIRQESPKEPGRRSRLWNHKDSFNVLKDKSGIETIEGLVLDKHMLIENKPAKKRFGGGTVKKHLMKELFDKSLMSDEANSDLVLETDAFIRMHKLGLLLLNSVEFTGCYDKFPKRLKWLCWHGFPLRSIPSDFPLESLVALDLRHSNLKQVWKGTKFLGHLKILNLSHAHRLAKISNFSALPRLERLILKDCTTLVEVHESIGCLNHLVSLNLRDCRSLRKLPRNIGVLKSLEILNISGCTNLVELPRELKKLESLEVLHVDGVAINQQTSTSSLCSWISKPGRTIETSLCSFPRFLVSLSLVNCNLCDNALPQDFGNFLPLLKCLNLSKNPITGLPDCIRDLKVLRVLRLTSCTRLQSLIGLPKTEKLFVGHCKSLEKITYLSPSFRPQQIEHTDCEKLVEVEGLIKLEPIWQVDSAILDHLRLKNLESLGIIEVNFFNVLSGPGLKKLPVQGLQECDVFSTFLPGKDILNRFGINSRQSSISLTLSSLPNRMIQGLSICFMYALSNTDVNLYDHLLGPHALFSAKISNKSKKLVWEYAPSHFAIPEANDDIMWLSYWKVGNKLQMEGGNEVEVEVIARGLFKLQELWVDVVFEQEDKSMFPSTQDAIDKHHKRHWVRAGIFYFSDRALSRDDIFLPMFGLGYEDEEKQRQGDKKMAVSAGMEANENDDGGEGRMVVVTRFSSL